MAPKSRNSKGSPSQKRGASPSPSPSGSPTPSLKKTPKSGSAKYTPTDDDDDAFPDDSRSPPPAGGDDRNVVTPSDGRAKGKPTNKKTDGSPSKAGGGKKSPSPPRGGGGVSEGNESADGENVPSPSHPYADTMVADAVLVKDITETLMGPKQANETVANEFYNFMHYHQLKLKEEEEIIRQRADAKKARIARRKIEDDEARIRAMRTDPRNLMKCATLIQKHIRGLNERRLVRAGKDLLTERSRKVALIIIVDEYSHSSAQRLPVDSFVVDEGKRLAQTLLASGYHVTLMCSSAANAATKPLQQVHGGGALNGGHRGQPSSLSSTSQTLGGDKTSGSSEDQPQQSPQYAIPPSAASLLAPNKANLLSELRDFAVLCDNENTVAWVHVCGAGGLGVLSGKNPFKARDEQANVVTPRHRMMAALEAFGSSSASQEHPTADRDAVPFLIPSDYDLAFDKRCSHDSVVHLEEILDIIMNPAASKSCIGFTNSRPCNQRICSFDLSYSGLDGQLGSFSGLVSSIAGGKVFRGCRPRFSSYPSSLGTTGMLSATRGGGGGMAESNQAKAMPRRASLSPQRIDVSPARGARSSTTFLTTAPEDGKGGGATAKKGGGTSAVNTSSTSSPAAGSLFPKRASYYGGFEDEEDDSAAQQFSSLPSRSTIAGSNGGQRELRGLLTHAIVQGLSGLSWQLCTDDPSSSNTAVYESLARNGRLGYGGLSADGTLLGSSSKASAAAGLLSSFSSGGIDNRRTAATSAADIDAAEDAMPPCPYNTTSKNSEFTLFVGRQQLNPLVDLSPHEFEGSLPVPGACTPTDLLKVDGVPISSVAGLTPSPIPPNASSLPTSSSPSSRHSSVFPAVRFVTLLKFVEFFMNGHGIAAQDIEGASSSATQPQPFKLGGISLTSSAGDSKNSKTLKSGNPKTDASASDKLVAAPPLKPQSVTSVLCRGDWADFYIVGGDTSRIDGAYAALQAMEVMSLGAGVTLAGSGGSLSSSGPSLPLVNVMGTLGVVFAPQRRLADIPTIYLTHVPSAQEFFETLVEEEELEREEKERIEKLMLTNTSGGVLPPNALNANNTGGVVAVSGGGGGGGEGLALRPTFVPFGGSTQLSGGGNGNTNPTADEEAARKRRERGLFLDHAIPSFVRQAVLGKDAQQEMCMLPITSQQCRELVKTQQKFEGLRKQVAANVTVRFDLTGAMQQNAMEYARQIETFEYATSTEGASSSPNSASGVSSPYHHVRKGIVALKGTSGLSQLQTLAAAAGAGSSGGGANHINNNAPNATRTSSFASMASASSLAPTTLLAGVPFICQTTSHASLVSHHQHSYYHDNGLNGSACTPRQTTNVHSRQISPRGGGGASSSTPTRPPSSASTGLSPSSPSRGGRSPLPPIIAQPSSPLSPSLSHNPHHHAFPFDEDGHLLLKVPSVLLHALRSAKAQLSGGGQGGLFDSLPLDNRGLGLGSRVGVGSGSGDFYINLGCHPLPQVASLQSSDLTLCLAPPNPTIAKKAPSSNQGLDSEMATVVSHLVKNMCTPPSPLLMNSSPVGLAVSGASGSSGGSIAQLLRQQQQNQIHVNTRTWQRKNLVLSLRIDKPSSTMATLAELNSYLVEQGKSIPMLLQFLMKGSGCGHFLPSPAQSSSFSNSNATAQQQQQQGTHSKIAVNTTTTSATAASASSISVMQQHQQQLHKELIYSRIPPVFVFVEVTAAVGNTVAYNPSPTVYTDTSVALMAAAKEKERVETAAMGAGRSSAYASTPARHAGTPSPQSTMESPEHPAVLVYYSVALSDEVADEEEEEGEDSSSPVRRVNRRSSNYSSTSSSSYGAYQNAYYASSSATSRRAHIRITLYNMNDDQTATVLARAPFVSLVSAPQDKNAEQPQPQQQAEGGTRAASSRPHPGVVHSEYNKGLPQMVTVLTKRQPLRSGGSKLRRNVTSDLDQSERRDEGNEDEEEMTSLIQAQLPLMCPNPFSFDMAPFLPRILVARIEAEVTVGAMLPAECARVLARQCRGAQGLAFNSELVGGVLTIQQLHQQQQSLQMASTSGAAGAMRRGSLLAGEGSSSYGRYGGGGRGSNGGMGEQSLTPAFSSPQAAAAADAVRALMDASRWYFLSNSGNKSTVGSTSSHTSTQQSKAMAELDRVSKEAYPVLGLGASVAAQSNRTMNAAGNNNNRGQIAAKKGGGGGGGLLLSQQLIGVGPRLGSRPLVRSQQASRQFTEAFLEKFSFTTVPSFARNVLFESMWSSIVSSLAVSSQSQSQQQQSPHHHHGGVGGSHSLLSGSVVGNLPLNIGGHTAAANASVSMSTPPPPAGSSSVSTTNRLASLARFVASTASITGLEILAPQRLNDWDEGTLRGILALQTKYPHILNAPPQKQHEASRMVGGALAALSQGPPWAMLEEVKDVTAHFGIARELLVSPSLLPVTRASEEAASSALSVSADFVADENSILQNQHETRLRAEEQEMDTNKSAPMCATMPPSPIAASPSSAYSPSSQSPARSSNKGATASTASLAAAVAPPKRKANKPSLSSPRPTSFQASEANQVSLTMSPTKLSTPTTTTFSSSSSSSAVTVPTQNTVAVSAAALDKAISQLKTHVNAISDAIINSYICFPPPALHYRVLASALKTPAAASSGSQQQRREEDSTTAASAAVAAGKKEGDAASPNGPLLRGPAAGAAAAVNMSNSASIPSSPLHSLSSSPSGAYSLRDKRRGIAESLPASMLGKKATSGVGGGKGSGGASGNGGSFSTPTKTVSFVSRNDRLRTDGAGRIGGNEPTDFEKKEEEEAKGPPSPLNSAVTSKIRALALAAKTTKEKEEIDKRTHLIQLIELFKRRQQMLSQCYPTIPSTPAMAAPVSHFHPAICLIVFSNPPAPSFSAAPSYLPHLTSSVGQSYHQGGGGGGTTQCQSSAATPLLDSRLRQLQEFKEAQRRYALSGNVHFAYWDLSPATTTTSAVASGPAFSSSGGVGSGVFFGAAGESSSTTASAVSFMGHAAANNHTFMATSYGGGGGGDDVTAPSIRNAYTAITPQLFSTAGKLMALQPPNAAPSPDIFPGGGATPSSRGMFGGNTTSTAARFGLANTAATRGGNTNNMITNTATATAASGLAGPAVSNNKDDTPLQCLTELIRSSLLPPTDFPAVLIVEPHRRKVYRILWTGAEFYPSPVITHFVDEFLRGNLIELLPPIKGARVTGPPQRMRYALLGVY